MAAHACVTPRRWQSDEDRNINPELNMESRRDVMVLGLSLPAFTLVHVIISLIGIAAGLVVMFGLLGSKPMPGLTAIFLLFTISPAPPASCFRSRSCCRRIS